MRPPGPPSPADLVALHAVAGVASPPEGTNADAVVLAYFGGYTCGEMATMFGVTAAMIARRIRQGLAEVRTAIRSEPQRPAIRLP